MLTSTEENYLKAIFKIAEREKKAVSTNAIAKHLGTAAATVTDMIKKLSEKEFVQYEKYKGVVLSSTGNKAATHLIRKHRLWEVFLVNKLRFGWHKVHDIAEELEHIDSEELISRLDAFLDYPKFDPHGDPIPNADGRFTLRTQINLSDMSPNQAGIVLGVKESETEFLKYLTKINVKLGSEIFIAGINEYDRSMKITIDNKHEEVISQKVSQSILMKRK